MRGPEERALGLERPASALLFESDTRAGGGRRLRLDAGDWTLFEAEGLCAAACAVEWRLAKWGGIVSFGLLSSPVGKESSAGAALFTAGDARVRFAAGARLETVALDGCRTEYLLTLSADAVSRVSERVVIGTRVGGIRVAGFPRRGADVSLRVAAFPSGPICGVALITVSRRGEVACGVSSRVRLARSVGAVLGYDEATAAVNGSLSVGVRALVLEAGASVHPVLGVSKALFVSWRWGTWE